MFQMILQINNCIKTFGLEIDMLIATVVPFTT